MKKFFLSCLLLTMANLSLFAKWDLKFWKDGIMYRYDRGSTEAAVWSCELEQEEVTIPSTVQYEDVIYTVVAIGSESANKWNSQIKKVNIPETVTDFGPGNEELFYGSSIEELTLPKNLTNMGTYTFRQMLFLKNIYVEAGNPYYFVYDNVLYRRSTSGKAQLTYVPYARDLNNGRFEVPETVQDTETMEDLRVTYIAPNAVYNPSITELYIPASVTNISSRAYSFMGFYAKSTVVSKLERIEVDPDNPNYESRDGILYDKVNHSLIYFPRAHHINVEKSPFRVPDDITCIEAYSIADSRFTSLDLNNVKRLGYRSIYNNRELREIIIPTSVEEIEEGAFHSIANLESFKVMDITNNTEIQEQTAGCPYYSQDGVLYTGTTLLNIPLKLALDENGEYAIKEGTTRLAQNVFANNTTIKKIIIPASMTEFGDGAFNNTKIEEISFADNSQITSFSTLCFTYCTNLKKITLPKSLQLISTSAFSNCSSLETVEVPDGSQLTTIMNTAFRNCDNLASFNFLGTCALQTIGENAFKDLPSLNNFVVPASVTQIKENAFANCSGLKNLSFAEGSTIETLGAGAFADCGLESINIPLSVKTIEMEAFKNCTALETVTLSKSANNISPQAFKYCTNLTAINVDKENTTYSSVDGMLLSKDKKTLKIFPAGKANESFTLLAPSITSIGDYAFYDCQNLKNVTIPNKVTSIGKRAFGLCSNLNTVTFLCDEMITNIAEGENNMAFDDGTQASDMFGNININVRKEKLADYQGSAFYQKFKSITPSFKEGKEEYIAVSENGVDLLSTSTTDNTYILPKQVTHDGKTYNVNLIGDYAFQNVGSGVKEVVIFDNVGYIGAKAFMTDIANNRSTVENIFFIESQPTREMLSTTRFDLDETGSNYSEIAATTKVYVKKSAIGTYREAFSRYDSDMFSYKIPGIKINNTYGTFAREFDVDLSDYPASENGHKVYAFTAAITGKVQGPGDYEGENGQTEYHVRMRSINDGAEGNGTYIPAGTGVLLKTWDKTTKTDEGFYYTIGETDVNEAATSVLVGITVNGQSITDTNNEFYVMQKGKFEPLKGATVNMPIHRAYLRLPDSAGAKIVFDFDDDDTTGISPIQSSESIINSYDNAVYDLQGRKVAENTSSFIAHPSSKKGIYIVNGKKIVK